MLVLRRGPVFYPGHPARASWHVGRLEERTHTRHAERAAAISTARDRLSCGGDTKATQARDTIATSDGIGRVGQGGYPRREAARLFNL